jgi:hypothetical protein
MMVEQDRIQWASVIISRGPGFVSVRISPFAQTAHNVLVSKETDRATGEWKPAIVNCSSLQGVIGSEMAGRFSKALGEGVRIAERLDQDPTLALDAEAMENLAHGWEEE